MQKVIVLLLKIFIYRKFSVDTFSNNYSFLHKNLLRRSIRINMKDIFSKHLTILEQMSVDT